MHLDIRTPRHPYTHSPAQVIKGLEMHVNNTASRRQFQARILALTFFRLNEFTRYSPSTATVHSLYLCIPRRPRSCGTSLMSALVSPDMEAESIPECRDLVC